MNVRSSSARASRDRTADHIAVRAIGETSCEGVIPLAVSVVDDHEADRI